MQKKKKKKKKCAEELIGGGSLGRINKCSISLIFSNLTFLVFSNLIIEIGFN